MHVYGCISILILVDTILLKVAGRPYSVTDRMYIFTHYYKLLQFFMVIVDVLAMLQEFNDNLNDNLTD